MSENQIYICLSRVKLELNVSHIADCTLFCATIYMAKSYISSIGVLSCKEKRMSALSIESFNETSCDGRLQVSKVSCCLEQEQEEKKKKNLVLLVMLLRANKVSSQLTLWCTLVDLCPHNNFLKLRWWANAFRISQYPHIKKLYFIYFIFLREIIMSCPMMNNINRYKVVHKWKDNELKPLPNYAINTRPWRSYQADD